MLYIGSYTPDSSGGGNGTGITRVGVDAESGRLTPDGVTPASGPSFLARHPSGDFLYSVVERPDGAVTAFAVESDGGLRNLGSQPTGGADPCHLSVDPTGRWLVTANYSSGTVSVHPIGADGALGERTASVQHAGTGPVTDRQEGPHAHQARFDPAGEYVLVNDLGADTVTAYRLDGGALDRVAVTSVPAGTGPRHLAFGADDLAYLAGELDSGVTVLRYAEGRFTVLSRVDASERGVTNYPSEIAYSDGFVYVANRGADSVGVFEAHGTELRRLAEVDTGGEWPRHLLPLGEYLYVANQRSDSVSILRRTPVPELVDRYAVPAPACLLDR